MRNNLGSRRSIPRELVGDAIRFSKASGKTVTLYCHADEIEGVHEILSEECEEFYGTTNTFSGRDTDGLAWSIRVLCCSVP